MANDCNNFYPWRLQVYRLPKMMKPVTIIGGGLGGLSFGIALRRRGIPATILEAGTYPRHKVCGEFIAGVTDGVLEGLGIAQDLADARQLWQTSWFHEDCFVFNAKLPIPARGISRHRLDARLAQRFEELGGSLQTTTRARRTEPLPEGHVWAAGRTRAPGQARWIGLKCHLPETASTAELEMHIGPRGYAGISRIEDGKANLCGLFRIDKNLHGHGEALLHAYLRKNRLHRLEHLLEASGTVQGSQAAVTALDYRHWHQTGQSVLLGDSQGLIPPFTGNGMSIAFESAFLALDPLESWSSGSLSWPETTQQTSRQGNRHHRRRVIIARLLHAALFRPALKLPLLTLARWQLLPFHTFYNLTHR
jgi:menaquinone-9 beta-reductase